MVTVSMGARRAALVVSSCLAFVLSACSSPGQGVLPKMPTLQAFTRGAVGGATPLPGTAQFDAPVVDVNTWQGTPMGTGGFSVAASPTLTGGPSAIASQDTSTSGAAQYFVIIGDFFASSGHGLGLLSTAPFATGTTALGPTTQAVVFDWSTGDVVAQAQNGSVTLSAAGTTPGQRVTGSLTASFLSSAAPPPPACTVDADCARGQVCQSGACVAAPPPPQCVVDADCARGESCSAGVCVATTTPPPMCVVDADCARGESCIAGSCLASPPPPQCLVDADCAAGQVCSAGVCVTSPPVCVVDSDCARGEVCFSGQCYAAPPPPHCVVDADCARGEVCRAGACVTSTPTSCVGRQGWGSLSGSNGGVQACTAAGTGSVSLTNAGAYIDSDSGQLSLVVADTSGAQRGLVVALSACPTAAGTVALPAGAAQFFDEVQVGADTLLYSVKASSGGTLTFSQVGPTVGGSFSVTFQGGAAVTGTFSVQ